MPTDYTNYDSNVKTTGLDVDYPVAGVNNPSQGLRDNFKAIKGTFGQVALELSQVRNYVLRKLDEGETFSHDNDLNYYKLIRAQLKAYSETFHDIGLADVVINLNLQNGNFQKVTLTKSADLSIGGFPTNHNAVGRCTLWVTCNNVNHKIFLPSDVLYGTDVNYITAGQLTFPAEGNFLIELISVNFANQYWIVGVQGLETGGGSGSTTYTLPTASVSTLGGVKVDGITIGINNGVIRVIGGTGGGGVYAVGATGASGPQGLPGIDSVVRIGGVYSYMYAGSKSAGNQTPFAMITLSGLSSNGTVELTMAHHHSGGGQHGAYRRVSYAVNGYTALVELENYEKTFDAGTTTGNVGFAITRPTTGNLTINWLGNVGFDAGYSFYLTVNSNQLLTFHKLSLD